MNAKKSRFTFASHYFSIWIPFPSSSTTITTTTRKNQSINSIRLLIESIVWWKISKTNFSALLSLIISAVRHLARWEDPLKWPQSFFLLLSAIFPKEANAGAVWFIFITLVILFSFEGNFFLLLPLLSWSSPWCRQQKWLIPKGALRSCPHRRFR